MSEEIKNLNEQPEQAPVEEKLEAPKKPLDKKTIGIIAGAAAAVLVLVLVLVLALGGAKDYTLGMGAVISLDSSSSATAEKNGNAQVDGTLATVVLDKDGKIVAVRVDAIQNKVAISADGKFTISNIKSKMELGDDYNMAKFGHSLVGNETVKEWYDQAKAFEAWCVGKTIDEVKNMPTQTMDNGYVISKDADLLAAGCTISITDFVSAVVKAGNDEQGVTFQAKGEFTLGLAATSYDSGSSNAVAAAEGVDAKDGAVQVYSDFAATVVQDGKILASLNDAIQPKFTFTLTGEITAKSFQATKRELKEGYNMAKFGHSLVGNETVVEWYLQSAEFSKYVVGMNIDELKAIPTQTMDNGYIISNDEALLAAGCTMSVDAIRDVVAKSIANAR